MQFKISNYIPRLNVTCLDLSLNSKRRGKKSVRKTKRKSLNVFFKAYIIPLSKRWNQTLQKEYDTTRNTGHTNHQ